MKTNTVVQEAIEKLENKLIDIISTKSNSHGMEMFLAGQIAELKRNILILKESLPKEREQIESAFNAGKDFEFDAHFGEIPNPSPNKENYFKQTYNQ